jgi:hypothetical protein
MYIIHIISVTLLSGYSQKKKINDVRRIGKQQKMHVTNREINFSQLFASKVDKINIGYVV